MITACKISYSVQQTALLQDIDLELPHGGLVVIAGPNGAGKSTLLSLLSNELEAPEQPVFFKDRGYEAWDRRVLPLHKAKFSQHPQTDIPLTVEEVVLMGRYPYFEAAPQDTDLKAVQEAMALTEVKALAKRDYNTLSGGEKQRVHLARVLTQLDNAIDHKLLFLDEPLNNLDVLHQHTVLHTLKNFSERGHTVVVVLHDLNLAARFASHIILMKHGKIYQQGNPDEVFTSECISRVYDFPCTICRHPVNQERLILFG
jgi:iron complex transport system ATP-binding protein